MLWKTLPYRDGLFALSEYGDIRRMRTIQAHKHVAGALLRHHSNGNKYCFVVFSVAKGKCKREYVHRLVCEHFNGPAPTPKHEVGHYDNDPTNNHFSNLRWVTKKENQGDRRRNETMPGQKNYGLRLWAES